VYLFAILPAQNELCAGRQRSSFIAFACEQFLWFQNTDPALTSHLVSKHRSSSYISSANILKWKRSVVFHLCLGVPACECASACIRSH